MLFWDVPVVTVFYEMGWRKAVENAVTTLEFYKQMISQIYTILSLQVLDLQDPQENRVSDGADGWSQGPEQDVSAVPAHVLAPGIQGTQKQ